MRTVRILVVDDEETIRRVSARLLQRAGYTTLTASDGPEALQVAESEGQFDLLLTDLKMPLMRGDELATRLRAAVPRLPVLYLTGHLDDLFHQRAALDDCEAVLQKPVTAQELLSAVAALLPPAATLG